MGSSNLCTPQIYVKSIGEDLKMPVFGENYKHEFQTFKQLAEFKTSNYVQEMSPKNPKQSFKDKVSPYSHKSYGRKPIVEPLLPLKKHVTLQLDFEQENFGKLEWDGIENQNIC